MPATEDIPIRIYCRIKPLNDDELFDSFDIDIDDKELIFRDPTRHRLDFQRFHFNGIFNRNISQEDIFSACVKDSIDYVLNGFNSTLFTYGQTGSGKTYTMTGSSKRYEDRGIIPRTFEYMISQVNQRNDGNGVKLFVSFMEIYNDTALDLLANSQDEIDQDEIVAINRKHAKNNAISRHQIHNTREALSLLMLAESRRMYARTSMNGKSSRSHCILTIYVESNLQITEHDNKTDKSKSRKRVSKFLLIDLAGSERAPSQGVTAQHFSETSNINRSLHYLELVIMSLELRKKHKNAHIPYRNSLLTSILQDSFTGGCINIMIATIHQTRKNMDESLSTCRFSQRISNAVSNTINSTLVKETKSYDELLEKISMLENELMIARGECPRQGDIPFSSECSIIDSDHTQRSILHWAFHGDLQTVPRFMQSSHKSLSLSCQVLATKLREKFQGMNKNSMELLHVSIDSKDRTLTDVYSRRLNLQENHLTAIIRAEEQKYDMNLIAFPSLLHQSDEVYFPSPPSDT
jgi:kinesin family member 6/9